MISERSLYIKQKKEEGWKICGVLPGFYPKELLLGAHILPVEIWDPPVDLSLSYPHLQPTICSIAKTCIAFLKTNYVDLLDLILVNHICDSLQNLGSLIRDFSIFNKPVLFFYSPKEPYNSSTKSYLQSIINRLIFELRQLNFNVCLEDVYRYTCETAISYELISKLFQIASESQVFIEPLDFSKIIRSYGYLLPSDFNTVVEQAINNSFKPFNNGYRLLLSGIFPYQNSIMDYLAKRRVKISQDESLFLTRRIPNTFSFNPKDAIQELAERYLSLPPCPTRGSDLDQRAKHIARLVKESNAQGILFLCTKFCEPEYFDLPYLTSFLDHQKIPFLVLETEIKEPMSMTNLTRLDAFLEGLL